MNKITHICSYYKEVKKQLSELQGIVGGSYLGWLLDFLWNYKMHGCYLNQYVYGEFFRLTPKEKKDSLTYPRFEQVLSKCNPFKYRHLLQDKREFNTRMSDFVKRKWLYVPDASYDQFLEFICQNEDLLVKPNRMFKGKGIHKYSKPYNVSDLQKEYESLKSSQCLLEERIHQHPDLTLGGQSDNTIRAYTIIDKEGNVHLLKTILRAGTGDSVVDNFHAGGCIYHVDLDYGVVVTSGLRRNEDRMGEWCKVHPGTSTMMIGFKIPNWELLKRKIKCAAMNLPECRYVGWDIAVTQDDIELIEGNEDADYELLEFLGEKGWWGKMKKYL